MAIPTDIPSTSNFLNELYATSTKALLNNILSEKLNP